jgi:hypothetical protein
MARIMCAWCAGYQPTLAEFAIPDPYNVTHTDRAASPACRFHYAAHLISEARKALGLRKDLIGRAVEDADEAEGVDLAVKEGLMLDPAIGDAFDKAENAIWKLAVAADRCKS